MYSSDSQQQDPIGTYYQIGIQDSGDAPFLNAAKKLGFENTVLIETPKTLEKLNQSGLDKQFKHTVPLERLEDYQQLDKALLTAGHVPTDKDVFVSDGHDRCLPTMYDISRKYNAAPANVAHGFYPPDKITQRRNLDNAGIPQSPWRKLDLKSDKEVSEAWGHVGSPAVLKASDGCFGLAVKVVKSPEEYQRAVQDFKGLHNFGGADFSGFLLEKYIQHRKSNGGEFNVQGVVKDGDIRFSAICEKFNTIKDGNVTRQIQRSYKPDFPLLQHLTNYAASCIDAQGYKNGGFHVDLIEKKAGPKNVQPEEDVELYNAVDLNGFNKDASATLSSQEDGTYELRQSDNKWPVSKANKALYAACYNSRPPEVEFIEFGARPSGAYMVYDTVSPYPPTPEEALRSFLGKPLSPADHEKKPLFAGDLKALSPEERVNMEKVRGELPPDVNVAVFESKVQDTSLGGRSRMLVTANAEEDILNTIQGIAKDRFKDSELQAPWDIVNTPTQVRGYQRQRDMSPSEFADERTSLLRRAQLARPLTRHEWIAAQAQKLGTAITSTVRSATTCCLPGGR